MSDRHRNNFTGNTRAKDSGAKLIFEDPILCSQFLKGYT